jgi:hypothetical protein
MRAFIAAAAVAAGCNLRGHGCRAQATPAANTVDSVRQPRAPIGAVSWAQHAAHARRGEEVLACIRRYPGSRSDHPAAEPALLDYINAESSMSEANAQRIARDYVAADVDEMKLLRRR